MKTFFGEHIFSAVSSMIGHKSLFLISFGMTGIISTIKTFLNVEFLGFSVGVLGFLTVLIIFDFITGVKAAKYNGEELTSRKGLRSVDKLISYFMFIIFTALMQTLLQGENYFWSIWLISNFKILVFASIFLWEFHSIGENLQKRYGSKPRIFTVLDVITKVLEKKVIQKIDKDVKIPSMKNEIKEDEIIIDENIVDELIEK